MNKKTDLPLIVLGIIVLVLAVLVVHPLFLRIKQNSANLILQKEALGDFENKSKNLKSFQATYGDCQENLAKMDQLFVKQEEPVEFIKFLEGEAKHSKLTIDLMSLTLKEGEQDVWSSASFQVDMDGSFPNFLQFLERIESSPYLISLSDFNLNRPTKNTNGDIVISFQVKVYSR